MSGVGRKDGETGKKERGTGSKNWILQIHAKWLKDNGYFEEAKSCAWQAKNYNPFEDVRQIRWGKKNDK
jgi:hypothetical protein